MDAEQHRAEDLRAELRLAVRDILRRVVRSPDVVDELVEQRWDPDQLIGEILQDSRVLSRAHTEYQPVVDHAKRLARHRRHRPALWPRGWRPRGAEIAALFAAMLLPVAVGWFVITYGISSPVWVQIPGAIAVITMFGTWPRLARFGLPETTWRWQQWIRTLVKLALLIPVHKREWEATIRDDVVLPEVRVWINTHKTPSYRTKLTLRDASGLAAPASATPLVRTSSIERFARELTRADPGAVGIAGRRGAGKTTLIDRTIDNEFTSPVMSPYLTVLASAPARYEAREFVLHLWAATCRAVLDMLTPDTRRQSHSRDDLWRRLHRREQQKAFLTMTARGLLGGVLTVVLGMVLAIIAWGTDGPRSGEITAQRLYETYGRVITAPSEYFLPWRWGLVIEVGACVLLAVGMLRLGWRLLMLVVVPVQAWAEHLVDSASGRRLDTRTRALRALARHDLRRIRFLQTRTEGWSGKATMAGGFGLGLTRSVERVEQPLTHPEVVDEYRQFLHKVNDTLRAADLASGVIVAIDELDKINDPVQAQEFVNEIKGVFGVPHCLFLVSVSEDALTSFERRGIPMRDAFDSAFRSIVHIEPFTLDESRAWLSRRAIGIPEPFIGLCHTLSGGLPRDLRRVAIAMHDLTQGPEPEPSLGAIARALVAHDLTAKITAFSGATQLADVTDDASDFLAVLNAVPTNSGITDMLATCESLLPGDPAATPSTLGRLQWEAACYFYFSATLLDLFTDTLTPHQLRSAHTGHDIGGNLHTLATARQHMALDPRLSWRLITAFRQSWRMPLVTAIDTPAPDTVHLRPQ